MKVHGDNKPEKISANSMPNKPGWGCKTYA